MDTDGLRQLARRLDATPSELLGLLALLVGSAAVALVLGGPWRPGVATGDEPALTTGALPVGEVTVHVSGQVAAPGVVTLADGARVAAALAAAGGPLPDADLAALNLARVLVDGEQVRVPAIATAGEAGGAADVGSSVTDADGRLDLNRATATDLEELPGIGPVLAERIVGWRDEHGPFREVGQLREVPGIGERTFQTLAPRIVVR